MTAMTLLPCEPIRLRLGPASRVAMLPVAADTMHESAARTRQTQLGEEAGGLGLVAAGGCDEHLPPVGVVPAAFDDAGPLQPVGYLCDRLACWHRPSIGTLAGTGERSRPRRHIHSLSNFVVHTLESWS